MKEYFDNVLQDFINRRTIHLLGESITKASSIFNVSEKTTYNRFKSYFKCTPSEYVLSRIYPDRATIINKLIEAKSTEEFREKINLPHTLFKGIYDKEFGVSTFQKAQIMALAEGLIVDYNPVREDNRSIWYSQLLGDGSYCPKRHAFRIIHGEKQGGYLKWKVALINKAYPKTPKEVTKHLHTQGHYYFSYYSGNIGNIDIPYMNRKEVVPLLTPLGWLLWWLDDGGKYQNIAIFCIDFEICDLAIKELSSYGIKARHCQNGICMCGQAEDYKFYKNFIDPFIKDIPECMMYKVEDIVGYK